MNYLFIDLETFGHKPEQDSIKAPKNYKSPEAIEKYQKENVDIEWRKNALKSLNLDVICAAWAWNEEPIQSVSGSDFAVMQALDACLDGKDPQNIAVVGHNLAFFDAPIIYHRAIKYGLKNLFSVFNFKRYDPRIKDTQQMFAGTDYKNHYSMNNIAEFLEIGGKTEGMDGSKVHDEYLAGNIDKICDYCRDDVELLRNLFWKLNQFNA